MARLLRAYSGAGLEDVALWHERDISHSSVERVAAPDATTLADFLVARATTLIDGLVVHPERMQANLDRTEGLIFSEAVLLRLVDRGLGRQAAYELVQKAALGARDGHGSFRLLLGETPEIAEKLTSAELDAAFDLHHHLRFADVIIDRALGDRS